MKTQLHKNIFTTVTFLFVCLLTFGQIDYTFDSDDEGFVIAGPGSSGGHSGTKLIATTGVDGANLQLRKNGTDVGTPATLTKVIIDLKNNSNADKVIIQAIIGGTNNVAEIALTTADQAEKSYSVTIDTETNPAWTGLFQLRLRFVNSAGTLDGGTIEIERIQIVDPLLSVEKNTLEGVSMFPNPASDILNVNSLNGGNLEITNSLGSVVENVKISTNAQAVNISNLASGIYFVKLVSDNKSFTQKIVIE